MPYILDIILVLILALAVAAGLKNGLIQSLIDFLGAIVAIIVANLFATPISTWIYEKWVKSGLYDRIYEISSNNTPGEIVDEIYTPLPEFIKGLLTDYGVTQDTLVSNATGFSESVATAMVDSLSPVFIMIIKFFVIIILFLLLLVIIKIVSGIVSPILRLPVLAQADGALGGVFGLLFALVVIWVVLTFVSFATYIIDSETLTLAEDFIESTIIFKYIAQFNPFLWIAL